MALRNGIVINANDCQECPRQSVTGLALCALCVVMSGLWNLTGYPDTAGGA